MKVLIGANAELTIRLVNEFKDKEDLVLVGRNVPPNIDLNDKLLFLKTDYSDISWCSKVAKFDNLQIIFVGTNVRPDLLVNLEQKEVSEVLKFEIEFAINCVKFLIPEMLKKNYGRFIYMGSKESSRGVVGGGLYSIVKNAQIGLSRSTAVEYAKFGITSNVIQLGYLPFGYSTKLKSIEVDNLKKRIPTNKSLSVANIASLIETLCESESINGAVIDVDQAVR
jgi:NAD(P)-dependent dehydrogenase (short-subunit alcohol dehydrogenase family)